MSQGSLQMKWFDFRIVPFRMTTSQKFVFVSVSAGVTLFAMVARFFRRHKLSSNKQTEQRKRTTTGGPGSNDLSLVSEFNQNESGYTQHDQSQPQNFASLNGTYGIEEPLTPQQLGVMGLEALATVITHWEDAFAAHFPSFDAPNMITSAAQSEFARELNILLDMAFTLQAQGNRLFLDESSILFSQESCTAETLEECAITSDEDSRGTIIENPNITDVSCLSPQSFVTAPELLDDLHEFEETVQVACEGYQLFQIALKFHEESPIACRATRADLVHCASDTEYLAKLHCIRLAFQNLLKTPSIVEWISNTGRQILTNLLCFGDKDTKEFLVSYDAMVKYLRDDESWSCIQNELEDSNITVMNFYDICLDFVILDWFCDMDTPPNNVFAVVQNRFLSNIFKEKALTTAVRSVLKNKKQTLQYPNGFMSHFYAISEQISPIMSWGLLGPDEELRDICHYFREQTIGFLRDIFNFQKIRYTTLEDMSADILEMMKMRANNIENKFNQSSIQKQQTSN